MITIQYFFPPAQKQLVIDFLCRIDHGCENPDEGILARIANFTNGERAIKYIKYLDYFAAFYVDDSRLYIVIFSTKVTSAIDYSKSLMQKLEKSDFESKMSQRAILLQYEDGSQYECKYYLGKWEQILYGLNQIKTPAIIGFLISLVVILKFGTSDKILGVAQSVIASCIFAIMSVMNSMKSFHTSGGR